jgi:hypothetical protein
LGVVGAAMSSLCNNIGVVANAPLLLPGTYSLSP